MSAINAGRAPAMADGGIVGKGSRGASGGNAFVVGDINVNVAGQGSFGNPAKDEQHNLGIGKQVAAAIDQQMMEWTTKQMRRARLLYGRR
ncbi:hypothetical protein ACCT24_35020 [Rhizobium ruizarguesonis]